MYMLEMLRLCLIRVKKLGKVFSFLVTSNFFDLPFLRFYASSFGKVEGACCFRFVRAYARPSVRVSVQNLLRYSFEISYMDSSSKIN